MGSDKLLPALAGVSSTSEQGAAMIAARSRLFMRAYLPRVRALPGARSFVERLLALGQRPIVASSASAEELSGLLARANLTDLLPLTTTSDDADRSKPDPDIIHAALTRARARAAESLMVGDTPYDLVAAARAGVPFIGVRSGGYDDYALRGAVAVYRDVAELGERLDESVVRAHSSMK